MEVLIDADRHVAPDFSSPTFATAVFEVVKAAWLLQGGNGKPQSFEWSVVGAVVACQENLGSNEPYSLHVVSIGAGTKCLGLRDVSATGDVVNDCHGEILAIRGFRRYLLEEMEAHCLACSTAQYSAMAAVAATVVDRVPEPTPSCCRGIGFLTHDLDVRCGAPCFRVRDGVTFHLFISDSPCGQACEFAGEPGCNGAGTNPEAAAQGLLLRKTGAKPVGDAGDASRPLRTKSGRSNLPAEQRTQSMSCTDKLARLCVIGLQGALASPFVQASIPLHSITVASGYVGDFNDAVAVDAFSAHQLAALSTSILEPLAGIQRALACCGVVTSLVRDFVSPEVHVVRHAFPCSRSAVIARHLLSSSATTPLLSAAVVTHRRFEPGSLPTLGAVAGHKRPRPPPTAGEATTVAAPVIEAGCTGIPAEESNAIVPTRSSGVPAPAHDMKSATAMGAVGGTGSRAGVVPCGSALNAYRDVAYHVDRSSGKFTTGARKPISPIWTSEALIASKGIKQGTNARTSEAQRRSRLCKASMAQLALRLRDRLCSRPHSLGLAASMPAVSTPTAPDPMTSTALASDRHLEMTPVKGGVGQVLTYADLCGGAHCYDCALTPESESEGVSSLPARLLTTKQWLRSTPCAFRGWVGTSGLDKQFEVHPSAPSTPSASGVTCAKTGRSRVSGVGGTCERPVAAMPGKDLGTTAVSVVSVISPASVE